MLRYYFLSLAYHFLGNSTEINDLIEQRLEQISPSTINKLQYQQHWIFSSNVYNTTENAINLFFLKI